LAWKDNHNIYLALGAPFALGEAYFNKIKGEAYFNKIKDRKTQQIAQ
jgi:hypothetical protein